MLFLKFQIGADDYLLDVEQVIEVLPVLELKRIPGAPTGVAGLFNYRGTSVPAIDLSELALGRPAERRMSTRIIMVHYCGATGGTKAGASQHMLGLIAEKVTETIQRDAGQFTDSGVTSTAAPWLGPVTHDSGRLLQRIEVEKLLPDAVSSVLFQPQGET